jgi:ribonucleoside-diphosphate reductase alpha chain
MTINFEMFPNVRKIDDIAKNILEKRYFHKGEKKFSEVAQRIVDYIIPDFSEEDKKLIFDMLNNRYFLPNSPCIVNAGKPNSGLSGCYVVDFEDTIEDIYKTKLDFALIARKGGGAGTTLSKIRPENSPVSGSTHGYAGGPIKFANTISEDMKALTQAGLTQ